jgi:hypothetical protein
MHIQNRTTLRPSILTIAGLFLAAAFAAAHAQAPAGPHRPAAVPQGYRITPFGYFDPSCVRQLAKGETLLAEGHAVEHVDGTIESVPACDRPRYTARGEVVGSSGADAQRPSIGHSWIEAGATTTNTSYGEISATWTVPSAPISHDGQTVYVFPGLVDINQDASIVQPVLGWNADFTNAWGIASWNCCISGVTWESPAVSVDPGDGIVGTVKSTCKAGTLACSTWDITTADVVSGESTVLGNSPSEGQTFDWAFAGALEVYSIARCSDYPLTSQLAFDVALYNDRFVKIADPGWAMSYWDSGLTPQCNYTGQVAAQQVTLDYGPAEPPATVLPVKVALYDDSNCGGGKQASHTVTLTNKGPEELVPESLTLTDPAFTAKWDTCVAGAHLASGASCTLTVSGGSTAKPTGRLLVNDTASDSPQVVSLSYTSCAK